jgi:hypothetical protein
MERKCNYCPIGLNLALARKLSKIQRQAALKSVDLSMSHDHSISESERLDQELTLFGTNEEIEAHELFKERSARLLTEILGITPDQLPIVYKNFPISTESSRQNLISLLRRNSGEPGRQMLDNQTRTSYQERFTTLDELDLALSSITDIYDSTNCSGLVYKKRGFWNKEEYMQCGNSVLRATYKASSKIIDKALGENGSPWVPPEPDY